MITEQRAAAGAAQARNPWERFGWVMAVVWLVFLVYPVIGLARSTAPPAWVGVGWVALGAFVVLYVIGSIRGIGGGGDLGERVTAERWWFFAGQVLCAALVVPAVGGVALSFLPFIMAFASYGLTRTAHWITFAGAVLVAALAAFLLPDGVGYLPLLAIITLLGVVNTISTTLIIRSARAERLGLELATSEGREAVARDVHDLLGHSLTVVRLKAELARRMVDSDPERAKVELAEIEGLAAEAIRGVRATVTGARTPALREQLADGMQALRDADIACTVDGDPADLSPAQSLTASWILREALTNVLRHAQATTVGVRLRPGLLAVVDDGVGLSGAEGNGLRGMRERAAAARAQLILGQSEHGGTRVEVTW